MILPAAFGPRLFFATAVGLLCWGRRMPAGPPRPALQPLAM
jgi:hypothetical protein